MPKAEETSTHKKKILFIEDNELFARILRKELDAHGYEALLARDGLEGLDTLHRTRCDLVLLDILMPNLDGFEVLKTIKENPEFKNIPVIVLSNLGTREDMAKAKDLGAALFLIKDQTLPSSVIATFNKLLQEHEPKK